MGADTLVILTCTPPGSKNDMNDLQNDAHFFKLEKKEN